MEEIGLIVSPSTWNVIKFVAFSLVLTPILEFLIHDITQRKATLDVLRGRSVAFRDTRLGLFSLHGTFWGSNRNRFLLLIIGTMAIAMELLLEFSFSSIPRTVATSRRVWMQPAHLQRYKFSSSSQPNLINEPVQFLADAADSNCAIQGDFNLRRRVEPSSGHLQYALSGNYTVRSPYLDASDNETVLCSAEEVRKSGKFLVPYVSFKQDNEDGVDLFNPPFVTGTGLHDNPEYSAVAFQVTRQPDILMGNISIALYVGRNSFCIKNVPSGDVEYVYYLCALRGKTAFAFAMGFWAEGDSTVTVKHAVMEMFGDAFKALHQERERQIRFLFILLFLHRDWHEHDTEISRYFRKTALEQLFKIALLVANEDGVAGLRSSEQVKEMYVGETEMASMKPLGFIPGALILLFLVVLVTCNILLWKRVTSAKSQAGNHTVEISLQWLRRQLLLDINEICNLSLSEQHFAYQLVRTNQSDERRLQLLPTFVDSCEC